MTRAVVLDVNETLLDLAALDGLFAAAFGDSGTRREWFDRTLRSALALAAAGGYRDFGELGAEALGRMAADRAAPLDPTLRWALRDRMLALPPYADVPAALARLRDAGFRVAALTNNPLAVVEAQLANADLRHCFERVLSVEQVGRLKPAPEVYRHAAAELRLPVADVRLVSAHAWDVAGAIRAGAAAAFVARPGLALGPGDPAPDIVGDDLGVVADLLIAREA